ncbi:MAG: acetyl-CoA carboxylase carboxyltransferase subunit beta [Calditrichaeota bacterium]|nr:acetyl-CoA carboxylase carboxyltransferase subunit beta [Calditrichota bacterium]
MDWFRKDREGLAPQAKKETPDGLWIKCESCSEIIFRRELERLLLVCPRCRFHFPMASSQYISLLIDDVTWEEMDAQIRPQDPLLFRDSQKYPERIAKTVKKTGHQEAIRTGVGQLSDFAVVLGVMDFDFLGGSVGSVVGEKIARAVDRAIADRRAVVMISSSGGMRMQEGMVSLMQMAKVSVKFSELAAAKLPYISVLTNPTTGGTTASFSMQGDVIMAEPRALIGFAGPRVIKMTIGQDLPEGFQRSEFLLEHGFIDRIVERKDMKKELANILSFFAGESAK